MAMKKTVAVLARYSLLMALLVFPSHPQKSNVNQPKKEAAQRITKPIETAPVNLNKAINSKQARKPSSTSQVVVALTISGAAMPVVKDTSGKGIDNLVP